MKKLFVMAGSWDIVKQWAVNQGIAREAIVYLADRGDERKVYGVKDPVVKQLHGWDEKPYADVAPLLEAINQRGVAKFLDDSLQDGFLLEQFRVKVAGMPQRVED